MMPCFSNKNLSITLSYKERVTKTVINETKEILYLTDFLANGNKICSLARTEHGNLR